MKSRDLWKRLLLCTVVPLVWLVSPCLVLSQPRNPRDLFKPVPVAKSAMLPAAEQQKLHDLRTLETTRDVQIAKIRLGLFRSKSMNLNVSGDKLFEASTERIEKRTARDFTWFGKIPDPSGTGEAIMVVKHGRVTGTIQAGGELYEVVPLGRGRHAVVHVDQTKFPRSSDPGVPSTQEPQPK